MQLGKHTGGDTILPLRQEAAVLVKELFVSQHSFHGFSFNSFTSHTNDSD